MLTYLTLDVTHGDDHVTIKSEDLQADIYELRQLHKLLVSKNTVVDV